MSRLKLIAEILAVFVGHFKKRAVDVLRINSFLAVWHDRGLDAEDFRPGMEFAVEQGWVEVLLGGDSFKLTDSGFVKA